MRYLIILFAFATVVGSGIGHGLWTGRWGRSEELEKFSSRLQKVPKNFSDWEGVDKEVDPKELAQSGLHKILSRKYIHKPSRQEVTVLLATGRPGPISVHTPDVCYDGLGFFLTDEELKYSFRASEPGVGGQFFGATFGKTGSGSQQFLKIYWSWGSQGHWVAPTAPRVVFGAQPALYKLYVVCHYPRENQQKDVENFCREFIQAFLPELKKSLFLF